MVIRSIVNVQMFEDFGKTYPLHKDKRETCGLVLTLPGSESTLYLDGKRYDFREGGVIFFPQGSTYDVLLPHNHMLCYVFNFFADDMDEFFHLKNCADLTESFAQAHRIWMRRREDEYYRDDCMSILYRLMAEVRRRYDRVQQPYRAKSKLTPMIEILHNEYTNPDFRISELSARTGYSERYISRLFRELCGMSPKQYLTDLRFRYAKELLAGDYSSIADVAYKAGFSDPCHFADSFRRTFGVTPGEYRRSKQNGM